MPMEYVLISLGLVIGTYGIYLSINSSILLTRLENLMSYRLVRLCDENPRIEYLASKLFSAESSFGPDELQELECATKGVIYSYLVTPQEIKLILSGVDQPHIKGKVKYLKILYGKVGKRVSNNLLEFSVR